MKAFMYHDIRDSGKTYFKTRMKLKSFLSIQQFRNQLKHILENYEVISSSDIERVNFSAPQQHYAILTFDDGLLDHYHVASILQEFGIKGTFLIPTLAVRDRKMIKSHKIQFILASGNEKKVVQSILSHPKIKSEQEAKTLWDDYSVSHWKNNWWSEEMVFVTNFLRQDIRGTEITDALFTDFVTKDEVDFCADFYLTESQIDEMLLAGMEIGGHGYTSEGLALLKNQEEDIQLSLEYIQKFHQKPMTFSYPNGSYNEDTIHYMNKYGVKYAYTTVSQPLNSEMNFLEIPRFDAPQTLPL